MPTSKKTHKLLMALLAAAVAGVSLAGRAVPAGATTAGVEVVGALPLPPGVPSAQQAQVRAEGFVAGIDEVTNELFYLYDRPDEGRRHIATYDLRSRIPTVKKDVQIQLSLVPSSSLRYSTYDRRHRMLVLREIVGGDNHVAPRVSAFDVDTGVIERWDLWSKEGGLPGFNMEGLTYSAEDDRLYLVGEMVVSPYGEANSDLRPQNVTVIMAIAATSPKDWHIAWTTAVPQCQQPLNTFATGAGIARSAVSSMLYVPCVRTRGGPRNSGIARIDLGPDASRAGQDDAAAFAVDFFPVAGEWTTSEGGGRLYAQSVFDRRSDRYFMQSLSTSSPGAWVFDGRTGGWAGFIAAPEQLLAVGVNEGTGQYYAASIRTLLVADGRDTPSPQGTTYPFGYGRYPIIVADPRSTRLFMQVSLDRVGLSEKPESGWVVLDDHQPLAPPRRPASYDVLTSDIDEGPNTVATHAGGVRGFGSRVQLVGGYAGVTQGAENSISSRGGLGPQGSGGGLGINDVGAGAGTRTITTAQVTDLDLRDAGSATTAQAVAPDAGTGDEWDARKITIAGYCQTSAQRLSVDEGACNGGPDAALATAGESIPHWPWRPVSCLDGGGEPIEPQRRDDLNGSAYAACSRRDARTVARASFDTATGVQLPQGGAVSVGSSSFEAESALKKAQGALTTATAIARDVQVAVGGATLSIAEVRAVATVAAHGRPGTAGATWRRSMSGVVVQPAGADPVPLGDCVDDGCQDTLLKIRRAVGEAFNVRMPRAEVTKTPKGAFGGVRKSDGEFNDALVTREDSSRSAPALEVIVYRDQGTKSRVVLQIAAIEATSIYTISAAPGFEFGPPTPQIPAGPAMIGPQSVDGGLGGGDVGSLGLGGVGATPSIPPITQIPQSVLAFLVRSPVGAVQLASVLLLLSGAVAAVRRRIAVRALVSS